MLLDEMDLVLKHPVSWWNLKVENGHIQEAEKLDFVKQWVASFFSEKEKAKLKKRLADICIYEQKQNSALDKRINKILMLSKKIANLWFYQIYKDVEPYKIHSTKSLSFLHHLDQLSKPIKRKAPNILDPKIIESEFSCLKLPIKASVIQNSPVNQKLLEDSFITWIGSSTFLLQFSNINILTDTNLSFTHSLFFNKSAICINLQDLSKIHIISYNQDLCKETPFTPSIQYVKQPSQFEISLTPKNQKTHPSTSLWEKKLWIGNYEKILITIIPYSNESDEFVKNEIIIEYQGIKMLFSTNENHNDEDLEKIFKLKGKLDLVFLALIPEKNRILGKNVLNSLKKIKAKKIIPFVLHSSNPESELNYLSFALKQQFPDLKNKIYFFQIGHTLPLSPLLEE